MARQRQTYFDASSARALDADLRRLWSQHPRFSLVARDDSFLRKIGVALDLLQMLSEELVD